jgi:hypothetical protein
MGINFSTMKRKLGSTVVEGNVRIAVMQILATLFHIRKSRSDAPALCNWFQPPVVLITEERGVGLISSVREYSHWGFGSLQTLPMRWS